MNPIIYLASGNQHKVSEFSDLARRDGMLLDFRSARALGGMPKVVEDTGTFRGNAEKKARALQDIAPVGSWILADDSGVCVDALDGAPGVESAYYAGPSADPAANLQKLARVMRDVAEEHRGAHFYCLLCLLTPSGQCRIFEGECRGRLLVEPRGGGGFGYDPLFIPDGYQASFAELGEEVKSRLSHRARAWCLLSAWWAANNP